MIDLFEKTIAGTLSEAERDRLEALVIEDEAIRRQYLEYLDLHGSLYWEASAADREPFNVVPMPKTRPFLKVALQIAACIALLAGGIWFGARAPESASIIATIEATKNCRWESSDLPTSAGAKLSAGRLTLTSGLATIRFASGAKVQLEGPASLDLIDPMRCHLIAGTLVADVPPPAQGFTVDTRTAELIDYGTEFGVTVDRASGETNVQVFTGIVDVAKKSDASDVRRLTTGQQSKIGSDVFQIDETQPEEISRHASARLPATIGETRITTADGNGADTYVDGPGTTSHQSNHLLLAKNPLHDSLSYARKIYLRFDLSDLATVPQGASLDLWLRQSGFGYASFVEDAEFEVFALENSMSANWSEDGLNWENAPGNDARSAISLQSESVTSLGTFVIPQGKDYGRVSFTTPQLAEALRSRVGQNLTLIIVRNTIESRGGGLVHAFASSRGPNAAAPMLRLR